MGQDRGTGANSWSGELVCAAMDQCREGIAVIDLNGRFVWMNAAFAGMHGYRRSKLLRSHIGVLFSPANMLALAAANRELWQIGEFAGEMRQTRKDGTEFTVFLRASVVRNEPGETIGATVLVRNNADATLIEQVSRVANEALSRRCTELETRGQHDTQLLISLKDDLRRSVSQLERASEALRVLTSEHDSERRKIEDSIDRNIAAAILPLINQLKALSLPHSAGLLIDSLEFAVSNLFTCISGTKTGNEVLLTPREKRVCDLVQSGLSSKEIAAVMGVSLSTVVTHRANIRKRLGLVGPKDSLTSHLNNSR